MLVDPQIVESFKTNIPVDEESILREKNVKADESYNNSGMSFTLDSDQKSMKSCFENGPVRSNSAHQKSEEQVKLNQSEKFFSHNDFSEPNLSNLDIVKDSTGYNQRKISIDDKHLVVNSLTATPNKYRNPQESNSIKQEDIDFVPPLQQQNSTPEKIHQKPKLPSQQKTSPPVRDFSLEIKNNSVNQAIKALREGQQFLISYGESNQKQSSPSQKSQNVVIHRRHMYGERDAQNDLKIPQSCLQYLISAWKQYNIIKSDYFEWYKNVYMDVKKQHPNLQQPELSEEIRKKPLPDIEIKFTKDEYEKYE